MYLAPDLVESTVLRQGDVISEAYLLGAVRYDQLELVQPALGGEIVGNRKARLVDEIVVGPAMIVSHCCEISLENGEKVSSIILAPLRALSSVTRPELRQQLRDTNLIDQTNPQPSFLKFFALEPHERITNIPHVDRRFIDGAVVDLSKMFSVGRQAHDFLLARKVTQLTDAVREKLALKVALYFYRNAANAPAAAA